MAEAAVVCSDHGARPRFDQINYKTIRSVIFYECADISVNMKIDRY